jgi:adenine-specific DNA-methyltransferase
LIKYIGSKLRLLDQILAAVQGCSARGRVLDVFSGTSRVGHHLKKHGYQVYANDHNSYAHTLAQCYVAADREDIADEARALIAELNELPGEPGYFTATFCEKARYLRPENGARVDAIRNRIEELALRPELRAVLLVSLMEAADRVDSTTGVQMAYLKEWAPRSANELTLRMPELLPRATAGKGRALALDALEFVRSEEARGADVAYLDPPYNQHSYLGNYHVWETLVRWDEPETYGVACKRTDCQERKSPYNSKRRCLAALEELIAAIDAPSIVLSFNNEGFIDTSAIEELLGRKGEVHILELEYARYVGARIGIHDHEGRKVGRVSHLHNKERIFVAR